MYDEWKMKKEISSAIQTKIEAKYPGVKLLFHGTTLTNAESIFSGNSVRVSNYEQAEKLCSKFNYSLKQVLADPDTYGHFANFVFSDRDGIDRDQEFYASSGLDQARVYAEMGPEWQDHLLRFFACRSLGIPFNFTHDIPEIADWIRPYKELPAIVILDASKWSGFKEIDPIFKQFTSGLEHIIPFPLPPEIKVLEIFEWHPITL